MSVSGFHHVGILVEDFDVLRRVFTDGLGVELGEPESFPDIGIEILWVTLGGVALELIRPLSPDTRAAAALAAGQGGVHHVALAVDDVDAALATLRDAGVGVRDQVSRAGVHGNRIAFLDPDGAGGTLIELVAPAA